MHQYSEPQVRGMHLHCPVMLAAQMSGGLWESSVFSEQCATSELQVQRCSTQKLPFSSVHLVTATRPFVMFIGLGHCHLNRLDEVWASFVVAWAEGLSAKHAFTLPDPCKAWCARASGLPVQVDLIAEHGKALTNKGMVWSALGPVPSSQNAQSSRAAASKKVGLLVMKIPSPGHAL